MHLATSLAYAASDVCSVEQSLLATGAGDGVARFGLCPGCPSLTGIFSRLPDKGASTFGGIGDVHLRSHVDFVYHILEIFNRLVCLSMRKWFSWVFVYVWGSRCVIVGVAAKKSGHVGWDNRSRVRLVAMPFLYSVMDGTAPFAFGLMLTLVEFVACLLVYRVFGHDDLPSGVRLTLYVVAICCMVSKMFLALVAISPLKKDRAGSESQDDAVGAGGGGAPSDGEGTGCVVTDEIVAGLGVGMTGTKEAGVADGGTPSEGTPLTPAEVLALTMGSAIGEAKVEDRYWSIYVGIIVWVRNHSWRTRVGVGDF